MIAGLGLDLCDVARLDTEVRRHGPADALGVFLPSEISSCDATRHPARHLAACFAAKEALFKALGLEGDEGWRWRDAEVTIAPGAVPIITLHGQLAALARERAIGRILLSLASTRRHAVATVVLEERP